jgi:hypothetical protein
MYNISVSKIGTAKQKILTFYSKQTYLVVLVGVAVAQPAVNREVDGSNPSRGVFKVSHSKNTEYYVSH